MPMFPCKEHADFKSTKHRRKQVNALLLDGCEEYHKTYSTDGWPRKLLALRGAPPLLKTGRPLAYTQVAAVRATAHAHAQPGGGHDRAAAAPQGTAPAAADAHGAAEAQNVRDSHAAQQAGKPKWACAYVQGGQEAADIAKQVGNVRSPTGTFFGLTSPGKLRAAATASAAAGARATLACH
jgi:hypothetical protein